MNYFRNQAKQVLLGPSYKTNNSNSHNMDTKQLKWLLIANRPTVKVSAYIRRPSLSCFAIIATGKFAKMLLSLLLISCVLTAAISGVSTTVSQRDDPISVLLVAHIDPGHVLSMSAIGEALVLRGHNVTLCTTEREGTDLPRQLAKKLGMTFLSAGPDILPTVQENFDTQFEDQFKFAPSSTTRKMVTEIVRPVASKLLSDPSYASAWDIVVADRKLAGLACLSMKWGVPFVALSVLHDIFNSPPWPYPLPNFGYVDNLNFSQRLVLALYKPVFEYYMSTFVSNQMESVQANCSQYSEPYHVNKGYFPIIYASVIGFDYSHPLLPTMHYVGPLIVKSKETPSRELDIWLGRKTSKSIIFFTMGSAIRLTKAMGSALMNGILRTNYSVIWSLRDNNRNILEGLSLSKERFYISSWIPATQHVLRHKAIAMAILHGGMGGVNSVLNNGIPMVVIPCAYDQYEIAARVEHAGVGVRLNALSMTADMIQNALETVASPKYRKAAEKMQKIFRQAGKAEKAAKLVEFYKEVGYDHLVPAYLKYKWSWVQYYNVDVNILLLAAAVVFVVITYKVCLCACNVCSKRKQVKTE